MGQMLEVGTDPLINYTSTKIADPGIFGRIRIRFSFRKDPDPAIPSHMGAGTDPLTDYTFTRIADPGFWSDTDPVSITVGSGSSGS